MARRRKLKLKKPSPAFAMAVAGLLVALAGGLVWISQQKAKEGQQAAPPHETAGVAPRQPDWFGGSTLRSKGSITAAGREVRPTLSSPARQRALGGAGREIQKVLREMENFVVKKKGASKPNAQIGFFAKSLEDGAVVTSHGSERILSAASNTKLFTTAAALLRLGPDFQFETKFASDAPLHEGVLDGDLWIIGEGDPTLSGEPGFVRAGGSYGRGGAYGALSRVAAGLASQGIRRIRGSLVLDDRYFSDAAYHPGWPSRDRGRGHALDVSALCVERHKIEVEARVTGDRVAFEVVPPLAGVHVDHAVTVVEKSAARGIVARLDGDTIRITGSIAAGDGGRTSFYMLDGPKLFGWAALRAFDDCHIKTDGGARRAGLLERPPVRSLAIMRTGVTLADVVRVTNRESDNLYAEMMLKVLGARFGSGGTFGAGVAVVRESLQKLGVPVSGFQAVDGSGLARESRASAATLVALLDAMARTPLFEIYKNSLAVGGEADGTLRKRFKEPGMKNRVRAKTGSIDGVTAISGYVDSERGETFIFSSLANYTEFAGSFKPDEDRCVRALAAVGDK